MAKEKSSGENHYGREDKPISDGSNRESITNIPDVMKIMAESLRKKE